MTRRFGSTLQLALASLLAIGTAQAQETPSSDPVAADESSGQPAGLADCSGVGFSISDASAPAGSYLSFTITKIGATSSICSVRYATADGTALAGPDYMPLSGTISFTPTSATQIIRVRTILSAPAGLSEHMFVNLSSPTGGSTISDGQGFGTITH